MISGYLQWGLGWCGYMTQKVLAKIVVARRGNSDKACGKHWTQRQTRALAVGQVV
jgi:hypothetical protein